MILLCNACEDQVDSGKCRMPSLWGCDSALPCLPIDKMRQKFCSQREQLICQVRSKPPAWLLPNVRVRGDIGELFRQNNLLPEFELQKVP